jgi:hypothetical protein
MKRNPHPSLLLAIAILLTSAFHQVIHAQDTNQIRAGIAESQRHIAQPDVRAMRLFVNTVDVVARQTAIERARQTALVARKNVREEIELTPEGAIARFGPHHVTFPAAMPAPIILRTPDGLLLKGSVLGLAYISDTGKTVLLAELKRSDGELLDSKTVIFHDVFDDVEADLVYEYTSTSFEQLVVIRNQLPTPQELGFTADENVQLTVLTEWYDPPQPRKVSRTISLRNAYQALGIQWEESLVDETLSFGALRIVQGRSFALGEPDLGVPTGKTWKTLRDAEDKPRQFLIEGTPYRLLKPLLDALPVRTASLSPREPRSLQASLQQLKGTPLSPSEGIRKPYAPGASRLMAKARTAINSEPGVVLDYLIVTTPLMNVAFGYGGKLGPAAAGYDSLDYWNAYNFEGYSTGWLADMYWSDGNQSSVGLVVNNAPGVGFNSFCMDPMYQYFIHPTNGGQIMVTITNLPADEYDLVIYGTRASEAGAPMFELQRSGSSLWHKGTTLWGRKWYSTLWDEGEQFVRFRNITVNNQTLTLISYPDAAGYASLSGLQIVPSDAMPDYSPGISNLLNIDFAGSAGKVGPAAVGLTASDYWNFYSYPWAYAASVPNLKWSDGSTSSAGMVVRNAPGEWGNSLPDVMFRGYIYSQNSGNMTITFTNLPNGNCDFYLYGHTPTPDDNTIFELWSDEVCQGIKGTSIKGYGPTSNRWEVGQQYVLFKDVTTSSGKPVVIQAKHTKYGYNSFSGLQIAYKGAADTDADGLPDGWELNWFGNLDQTAASDPDSDGLSNLREYQLAREPLRHDSDADGIIDGLDNEFPWLEDASPQGCFQSASGGDNWTWVSSWSDGIGWNGGTVYPHSGQKIRVTANTTNSMHQHAIDRAVSVVRPGTGDMLYAYVNLDPAKPPSEVMLQFYTMENNGSASWEHRAYWGSNNINQGTEGTASRYRVGDLPLSDQWVRLEVPASAVGLEGKVIEGMAFTLWGGRVAWDSAGVLNPDIDGDGWLDSIEMQWFGTLSYNPGDDYDGDRLPNVMDAEPTVFDTVPPVFEITSPGDGDIF